MIRHHTPDRIQIAILSLAVIMSALLHLYHADALCLNEDEAAQGYNTFSVLTTGYDEYGRVPLRYLSFGENKLPLSGMLSAPFIALFGLSDLTVRLPSLLLGSILPILFYRATLLISRTRTAALLAAIMSACNPWIITMTRQLHEANIVVVIVLILLIFHSRLTSAHQDQGQGTSWRHHNMLLITWGIVIFMGLYTYHSAKIIIPAIALSTIILIWKSRSPLLRRSIVVLVSACLVFLATEAVAPTNRVSNLSYFTSTSFTHEIEEGRRGGGSPLYYNKIVYGAYQLGRRFGSYISPDFFFGASDLNSRFRIPNVLLISHVEYILSALGLLYLFITRHRYRWLLGVLLLVSILPAVLAHTTDSVTRSFTMVVPIIMIVSIVLHSLFRVMRSRSGLPRMGVLVVLVIVLMVYGVDVVRSLRAYFIDYLDTPSALVVGQWQCGSQEMSQYVWSNYDDFRHIVITRQNGQPYIFLLFYGGPYPPRQYQKVARTMPYNEYGFWEQESFDKFDFQKPVIYDARPDTLYIMTAQEVKAQKIAPSKLTPIMHRGQVRYYAVHGG